MVGISFRKPVVIIIIFICIILGCAETIAACTLWAAAGPAVVSNGTLIAKNRDWTPALQQLELFRPRNGYQYIGLYALTGRMKSIRAGINEHGLVVINATVPNYLEEYSGYNPLPRLLSQCRDIAAISKFQTWFFKPEFLMLADHQKIAIVEIGLGDVVITKIAQSGTLCHTNHYLMPELRWLNPKPVNTSSEQRLTYIQRYLASKQYFSLTDFVKISYSQNNGPENSLWRNGITPDSVRTVATWIVSQPAKGVAVLFVRLANPRQSIKEYLIDVKKIFQGKTVLPIR